jgi:hypothetical protein
MSSRFVSLSAHSESFALAGTSSKRWARDNLLALRNLWRCGAVLLALQLETKVVTPTDDLRLKFRRVLTGRRRPGAAETDP